MGIQPYEHIQNVLYKEPSTDGYLECCKEQSTVLPSPLSVFTYTFVSDVMMEVCSAHSRVDLCLLLSVPGQKLSLDKLNKLSLCKEDSDKHTQKTRCSNSNVDQPQHPPSITAERTLEQQTQRGRQQECREYNWIILNVYETMLINLKFLTTRGNYCLWQIQRLSTRWKNIGRLENDWSVK